MLAFTPLGSGSYQLPLFGISATTAAKNLDMSSAGGGFMKPPLPARVAEASAAVTSPSRGARRIDNGYF